MAEDEQSSEHDEDVKDCNGRLIPRLIVRSATMVEVYVTVSVDCQTLCEVATISVPLTAFYSLGLCGR